MNKYINRNGNCIDRVVAFGGKTDIVFTPKETALFASLAPIKAALALGATNQVVGNRGFREGSDERANAARVVRTSLRDIAEIAKALHKAGVDIGSIEAFRMPPTGNYRLLAATARAVAALVEDRKTLFVERGLAATFDEDLIAAVEALEGVGSDAGTSLAKQVNSTASLTATVKAGMLIVVELRAILRVKFRNQPGLLAEWTSVSRVARPGEPDPTPSENPSGGSGSGSGDSGSTTPPSGS